MNLLKVSRLVREMTQYELAKRTGLSQSTISLIESGMREMSEGEKKLFEDTLNLRIDPYYLKDFLFSETDEIK
jgi:transcriptional regulator with XRE-family HTH domain